MTRPNVYGIGLADGMALQRASERRRRVEADAERLALSDAFSEVVREHEGGVPAGSVIDLTAASQDMGLARGGGGKRGLVALAVLAIGLGLGLGIAEARLAVKQARLAALRAEVEVTRLEARLLRSEREAREREAALRAALDRVEREGQERDLATLRVLSGGRP